MAFGWLLAGSIDKCPCTRPIVNVWHWSMTIKRVVIRHCCGRQNVEIIHQLGPTQTNTPDTYRFLNSLFVCVSLIYRLSFLLSFSYFLPESSLVRTAYNEHKFQSYIRKPWLCRICITLSFVPSLYWSYHHQAYCLFRGGLTSEYYVVRNRSTLI